MSTSVEDKYDLIFIVMNTAHDLNIDVTWPSLSSIIRKHYSATPRKWALTLPVSYGSVFVFVLLEGGSLLHISPQQATL